MWCLSYIYLFAKPPCRSFGVVMWEMLTGEVPYKDVDSSAIIWGVGNNSLHLPVPESCPDSFKLLLRQCWWVWPEGDGRKDDEVRFLFNSLNGLFPFLQELQAQKQAFLSTDPLALGHRFSRHPFDPTGNLFSNSGKPLWLWLYVFPFYCTMSLLPQTCRHHKESREKEMKLIRWFDHSMWLLVSRSLFSHIWVLIFSQGETPFIKPSIIKVRKRACAAAANRLGDGEPWQICLMHCAPKQTGDLEGRL